MAEPIELVSWAPSGRVSPGKAHIVRSQEVGRRGWRYALCGSSVPPKAKPSDANNEKGICTRCHKLARDRGMDVPMTDKEKVEALAKVLFDTMPPAGGDRRFIWHNLVRVMGEPWIREQYAEQERKIESLRHAASTR